MRDKLREVDDLMVRVDGDGIATEVTLSATIVVDNPQGRPTAEIAAEVRALLPEQLARWSVYAERPATFAEKLEFLASGNAFGSPPMRNGHELQRVKAYADEPCWRIEYLADLRAKYPERVDEMVGWHGGDFPEGWVHGPECFQCHGTGVQRKDVTVAYVCRYCEERHDTAEGFNASSCLLGGYPAITKGIVDEWREDHEHGEHEGLGYRKPGCPLCAADNMARKARAVRAP